MVLGVGIENDGDGVFGNDQRIWEVFKDFLREFMGFYGIDLIINC